MMKLKLKSSYVNNCVILVFIIVLKQLLLALTGNGLGTVKIDKKVKKEGEKRNKIIASSKFSGT